MPSLYYMYMYIHVTVLLAACCGTTYSNYLIITSTTYTSRYGPFKQDGYSNKQVAMFAVLFATGGVSACLTVLVYVCLQLIPLWCIEIT